MYHTTYQQTQNIKTLKGQINIRKVLDLWLASICFSKGLYELVLSIPKTFVSLDLRVEIPTRGIPEDLLPATGSNKIAEIILYIQTCGKNKHFRDH